MLSYIIGALLAVAGIGTIILKLMKGSVAEGLLQNQQTNAKVINIQTGIVQDQAALAAQQAQRDALAAQLKAQEAQNATQKDLIDFANDPNKSSSN